VIKMTPEEAAKRWSNMLREQDKEYVKELKLKFGNILL